MILIGQFDSPFVRRVGVALRFYRLDFEHRPHSVFRDAEAIAAYNPLRRVPTLVLDDGTVLTESFVCLEVIDEQVAQEHGEGYAGLLCPRRGSDRRAVLRCAALAAGVADKAVSLAYEREIRETRSTLWAERCTLQLRETLAALEAIRAAAATPYLFGEHVTHADIALTTAMTFIDDAHAGLIEPGALPHVRAHAARCEALPELSSVRQAFGIPRG